MKTLVSTAAALLLLTGIGLAQQRDAGRRGIPTNSPEPLTIVALAGGAAAAGGVAYRMRRRKGK